MTYDCLNATLCDQGARVFCAAGHHWRPGSLTLRTEVVLSGETPHICRVCLDFESEEEGMSWSIKHREERRRRARHLEKQNREHQNAQRRIRLTPGQAAERRILAGQ
jgi:hypothetical protein